MKEFDQISETQNGFFNQTIKTCHLQMTGFSTIQISNQEMYAAIIAQIAHLQGPPIEIQCTSAIIAKMLLCQRDNYIICFHVVLIMTEMRIQM